MAHPLDGMHVKLARANHQFKAVKRDIERLVHSYIDLIPNEFDPQSGQHVFRAQRDSLSPDWLSPVIGDCVHNMRASLDYLVPDNAVGVFEQLQPFYGPNSQPWHHLWRDPVTEPLALLYALDTHDKHRSLNLTEDVLSLRFVGLEGYRIMAPPVSSTLMGNFRNGAVIARMSGQDLLPEMNVYLRATTDVAFDRDGPAGGEPVIQVLDDIRQTIIGRVLPAFRPFFPGPWPVPA